MKVFGVTVHFVDEGVDTGPIILQRAIELPGRAPTPTRSATRCARSSTSCCCEAVAADRPRRRPLDPGHPRRVLVAMP